MPDYRADLLFLGAALLLLWFWSDAGADWGYLYRADLANRLRTEGPFLAGGGNYDTNFPSLLAASLAGRITLLILAVGLLALAYRRRGRNWLVLPASVLLYELLARWKALQSFFGALEKGLKWQLRNANGWAYFGGGGLLLLAMGLLLFWLVLKAGSLRKKTPVLR